METKRINVEYLPGEDVVKVITTESHNDGDSGDICQSVKTYGDVTGMQERIDELEETNGNFAERLSVLSDEVETLRYYRSYWRERALKAESHMPIDLTLLISACNPEMMMIMSEEDVVINDCVYDITEIEVEDSYTWKLRLMLNAKKTVELQVRRKSR